MNPHEQCSLLAEYLSICHQLKETSPKDQYRRANYLSWYLAMTLPAEVYNAIKHALLHPDQHHNIFTVCVIARERIMQQDGLTSEDILVHAPKIRKNKTQPTGHIQ